MDGWDGRCIYGQSYCTGAALAVVKFYASPIATFMAGKKFSGQKRLFLNAATTHRPSHHIASHRDSYFCGLYGDWQIEGHNSQFN